MKKVTILEALAEIKMINKRIEKKQQFILENLFRQKSMVDPLASDGGSSLIVEREFQSITDLLSNLIKIRAEINKANSENELTVEGVTLTVAEWLVWKREVLPVIERIVSGINMTASRAKTNSAKSGGEDSLICHVNLYSVSALDENSSKIRETLDGKLALYDATIFIEIP